LPFSDNDERRLNIHGGLAQGVNHCEHERRRDVSRTQIDDPDKRPSGADGGTTEGNVMSDDDATLVSCAIENIDIRPANQLFVPSRAQITPRARRPSTTSGAMFSSDRRGKPSGFKL